MMMNPKTIVTNLLLLLLLQISRFSTIVLSIGDAYYRKDYNQEFSIRPGTVTNIVVSNELYGLKKGNAGFVCAHGPKIWRKSKPGDRYNVLRFENTGKLRYKFIDCHLRSNLGYVNFPIYVHPDTTAYCYPSFVCTYNIRKDGVHYKHEKKFYPWQKYPPRSKA
ncbi:hypothetical protein V5N11_021262 [Cardamine amara subsp. amara]|uniref:S-protein homolog n=1 Tax=Cardamine amara subsp. amara TaxID=228776 RepID=A0ABD1B1Y1_CARAN